MLCNQPNKKRLCQKIEIIQCYAALANFGAIKGTSQAKLYNEWGLESLEFRLWFKKLCLIFKIKKTGLPEYLVNMMPQRNHQYNTQSVEDVKVFYCRTDVLKYSYFPHAILE